MRLNPYKRDRSKYYQYYRANDHDIEDYFKLNEEIEDFISRGQLRQFMVYCKERRG